MNEKLIEGEVKEKEIGRGIGEIINLSSRANVMRKNARIFALRLLAIKNI